MRPSSDIAESRDKPLNIEVARSKTRVGTGALLGDVGQPYAKSVKQAEFIRGEAPRVQSDFCKNRSKPIPVAGVVHAPQCRSCPRGGPA